MCDIAILDLQFAFISFLCFFFVVKIWELELILIVFVCGAFMWFCCHYYELQHKGGGDYKEGWTQLQYRLISEENSRW